jgi:uncharacterized membrane protein
VKQKNIDRLFKASLMVKAVDGFLETAGGVLLLVVSPSTLNSIVAFLTQHELAEDPRDFLANYLTHLASTLSTNTLMFAAAYLLVDGGLKIFLAVAVLEKKAWAYVPALLFLSAFIVYQLYRFLYSFSLLLLLLALFDVVVALLVWREYERSSKRRQLKAFNNRAQTE